MARRKIPRAPRGMATAATLLAGAFLAASPPSWAEARAGRAAAHTAAAGFSFATRPALSPRFNPAVPHYVTRCEPTEKVTIKVADTNGTPVSVDQQPVATRSFSTTVGIGRGQRFVVRAGAGPTRSNYSVACLPAGFPRYSAQVAGHPQASYYLVTPSAARAKVSQAPYVVFFDRQGVPVWWYYDQTGSPLDANVMPNGDLSWDVYKNLFARNNNPALIGQMLSFGPPPNVSAGFNVPTGVDLVEHSLDGTTVNKVDTVGSPTDFHEGLPLANGDFLMTSYALRRNANLSPISFTPAAALDASFQVVSPRGVLVSSWTGAGRISPSETFPLEHGPTRGYPGVLGTVWDYQHINSVVPDGDGYLVSLAHTNAVYLVSASDGSVEWKLGGTQTAQSLTIIGDPSATREFHGQSDAQAWPDGTVSVYVDGENPQQPARVLRFRIDTGARIATLVQTLTGPFASTPSCCGSARLLLGGDWLVSWGTSGIVDELAPNGQPVLRLTFAAPYYTYRAVPVLPGQLRLSALLAGMDAMTPRIPSGALPPPLSRLRASYQAAHHRIRVRFTLGWPARVRFAVARCEGGGSLRHRCTKLVRLHRGITRVGDRGSTSLALTGPIVSGLAPGEYRLIATPIKRRRSGQHQTAIFRVS